MKVDEAKLQTFVGKMVGDMGAAIERGAGRGWRPGRTVQSDGRRGSN